MLIRPILRNAGMASLQVLVSGGVLFALYYFLLRTLGATDLGIWSIVLATSSATRLSELGLSGGVVRFVAKYLARHEEKSASAVVQTAAVSVVCVMGVIIFPLYPLLAKVIGYFLTAEAYSAGLSLLPFALISLWLGSVSSVFASGLDGVLRTDIRSWIMMGGVSTHLIFVFFLVPTYGLLGLAYSQVIQAVFILVLTWYMLRRSLRTLPLFPFRWDFRLFKEMFKYGLNIQVGSIAQLLLDPITKMLLSKFSGLESVAYFEMSNRMVTQFRSLVVSANQVMVPIISRINEATPGRIEVVYRESYGVFLFVALPLFSGLVAMLPMISELWVGSFEVSFVSFSVILAFGWFLNTINAPSYYSNMGTGHLGWNTLAHVTIGVLNIGLGVLLGWRFGGIGVVAGFAVALALGSALVIVSFHSRNNIPLSELFPREQRRLVTVSLLLPIGTWAMYMNTRQVIGLLMVVVICSGLLLGVLGSVAWRHPIRRWLQRAVNSGN